MRNKISMRGWIRTDCGVRSSESGRGFVKSKPDSWLTFTSISNVEFDNAFSKQIDSDNYAFTQAFLETNEYTSSYTIIVKI